MAWFAALEGCRRSSVVERTLGKGEVDSSILSGGTSPSFRTVGMPATTGVFCAV